MTDHCQFPNCFEPEFIGCHAGEPDHKKCHHWQIGQLRNECQETSEILTASVDVGDVRTESPSMLYVTVRAIDFLRDTEPPDGAGHG